MCAGTAALEGGQAAGAAATGTQRRGEEDWPGPSWSSTSRFILFSFALFRVRPIYASILCKYRYRIFWATLECAVQLSTITHSLYKKGKYCWSLISPSGHSSHQFLHQRVILLAIWIQYLTNYNNAGFWIRDILVRIRILIRILGSVPLAEGSGSGKPPEWLDECFTNLVAGDLITYTAWISGK